MDNVNEGQPEYLSIHRIWTVSWKYQLRQRGCLLNTYPLWNHVNQMLYHCDVEPPMQHVSYVHVKVPLRPQWLVKCQWMFETVQHRNSTIYKEPSAFRGWLTHRKTVVWKQPQNTLKYVVIFNVLMVVFTWCEWSPSETLIHYSYALPFGPASPCDHSLTVFNDLQAL